MSRVTNYIITAPLFDNALKSFREAMGHRTDTPLPSEVAPGNKAMEIAVYCFAGNCLNPEDVAEKMRAQDWEHPEDVCLLYLPEEAEPERFREYDWRIEEQDGC